MGDNFRSTQPFLQFGGKIDPLSEIRNAGIVTNGSVFWVRPETSTDYTTFQAQVGIQNTFGTIQSAIDKARDDKNDYVLVTVPDSNAVYTLGTALDVNKDRLHLIGVGFNRVADQYAITLRGFATTAAGTPIDAQMVDVTAGGVEFAGIKVLGTMGTSAGGTMTGGLLRLGTGSAGTAHDFYAHDASFEFSSQTGLFELSAVTTPGTVHGARFENCFIGNVADGLEGAGAGIVALGAGGKRWSFYNNRFALAAGSTANSFVVTGTGAKDYTLFENNKFIHLGTVTMVSAFTGSVTVRNPVVAWNNVLLGSITNTGTDPNVWVAPASSGTRALVYDSGLAIGTAMLVAA